MARIANTKPPGAEEPAEAVAEAVTETEAVAEPTPAPAMETADAAASTSLGPKDVPVTKQSVIATLAPSDKALAIAKAVEKNGVIPAASIGQAIAPALPKLLDETGQYAPGLNTSAALTDQQKIDQKGVDKKRAHSMVERRRRDKINSKIAGLQDLVPEYIVTKGGGGASKTHKNHKANILENTIHYINDLESELFKFDPAVRVKIHEAARNNLMTESGESATQAVPPPPSEKAGMPTAPAVTEVTAVTDAAA